MSKFKIKLINFNLYNKITWFCNLFFLSLPTSNNYKKEANL